MSLSRCPFPGSNRSLPLTGSKDHFLRLSAPVVRYQACSAGAKSSHLSATAAGTVVLFDRLELMAGAFPGDEIFSDEARRREEPALRALVANFTGVPGVVAMHGGLPASELFPIERMSFKLKDGTEVEIRDPKTVAAAQQYTIEPYGYPPLQQWCKQHVEEMHHPPGQHQVLVTNGANDTNRLVLDTLLNPGDYLLVEEHMYSHLLETMLLPRRYNLLPVALDGQGMVPDALRSTLAQFHSSSEKPEAAANGSQLPLPEKPLANGGAPCDNAHGFSRPRIRPRSRRPPGLLYLVPHGQNPTGVTYSAARMAEIYTICREFGVMVLEDDAYFYLQYPRGPDGPPGLDLGNSFLQQDADGRVVRVDSFAKALSPGFRVGWVTAAPAVVEKLMLALQAATLGPNSMGQVLLAGLLQSWGRAGLEAHLRRLQQAYAHRCQVLVEAVQQELGGLVEVVPPKAGMFLWLKLTTVEDARDILDDLLSSKVAAVPGHTFSVAAALDPGVKCPYLRLSYSNASVESLREGVSRIAGVLRAKATTTPTPQDKE